MGYLMDVAKVIRSKNSGPFEITFDVLFDDPDEYRKVKESGALTKPLIANLYGIRQEDIVSFLFFDPARAFKFTLRRQWRQGGTGERDTFGAQQHAPLMYIKVPD